MPLVAPTFKSIGVTYDGGGSALTTTNSTVYVTIPYNGRILDWSIVANTTGSIVVDVWKLNIVTGVPTVANTITGTDKPTLSSAQRNRNTNLSAWTNTFVVPGDIIAFTINSVTTVNRVSLALRVVTF